MLCKSFCFFYRSVNVNNVFHISGVCFVNVSNIVDNFTFMWFIVARDSKLISFVCVCVAAFLEYSKLPIILERFIGFADWRGVSG